jgi:hypothetical protein
MSKYSFYCKHCGDAFFSDDKGEVEKYKKRHRRLVAIHTGINSKVCNYNITDRDTFARPKLAEIINEEIKESEVI